MNKDVQKVVDYLEETVKELQHAEEDQTERTKGIIAGLNHAIDVIERHLKYL
jgi:hypothetical protein